MAEMGMVPYVAPRRRRRRAGSSLAGRARDAKGRLLPVGASPRRRGRGKGKGKGRHSRASMRATAAGARHMTLTHPGPGATVEARLTALERNQTVLAHGILSVARVAGQALQAAYSPRKRLGRG